MSGHFGGYLTASGTLSFSDVDLSDTHDVTITGGSHNGTLLASIDSGNDSTGTGSGTISWNYSINDADIDGLTNATDTFTIHLNEYNWNGDLVNTVDKVVTINLTGDTDSSPPPPPPQFTPDPNDFDNLGLPGSQSLNGNPSGTLLYGGAGDDTINGQNLDDTLYGGSGNDTIHGQGGNDTMYGGSGNDIIVGNNGQDIIIGGYGADNLTGGTGGPQPQNVNNADTFVYLSTQDSPKGAGNFDTITDFTHGQDKLDFSAIASLTGVQTGEPLSAGGALHAGEIGWVLDGLGNTIVYANASGADETIGTNTDMEFHLTGVTNLAATDIIHA